tara:strand:+ start:162 stop:296 length:135 start_codon:yes stop_codon:yes gene_type:complete
MSLVGLLEDIKTILLSLEVHIIELEKENRKLKSKIKKLHKETIL